MSVLIYRKLQKLRNHAPGMDPPLPCGRDEALELRARTLYLYVYCAKHGFILYSQLINSFILLNLPSEIPFTFIISSFFGKARFFPVFCYPFGKNLADARKASKLSASCININRLMLYIGHGFNCPFAGL